MRKIFLALLVVVVSIANATEVYATFISKPSRGAKVAFSSSGIVGNIKVDVGSHVKKGQVLASLNSDDLSALESTAKAQAKFATAEYNRYLQVKQYISPAQLDSYRLKKENAITQLKYSQSNQQKTVLRAPFNGVITTRNIEIGDMVTSQTSTSPAFVMQTDGPMKLLIKYDSKYYGIPKVGSVFIYSISGSKATRSAKITKIYPTVEEKTNMILAEAMVDNLPSGLFGTGKIIVGK
jgi:RND family efflux transporter MFP subunit